ncbi:hypothetical protein KAU39_01840 [bacterium]|nr:hypothetical protein [bacterium]
MDKSDIIVIGLTGSLGSGCTTFAEFFNNFPKEKKAKINLIDYLEENGYFNGNEGEKKGKIDFANIEKEIYDFYKLIEELENYLQISDAEIRKNKLKIIKNRIFHCFEKKEAISHFMKNNKCTKLNLNKETIEYFKQCIFSEVKVLLEQREALNALDDETSKLAMFVNKDNKQHHFRTITVSDIIIFKVLFNYTDDNLKKLLVEIHKNDKNDKKKVENFFITKVETIINCINNEIKQQDCKYKTLKEWYGKICQPQKEEIESIKKITKFIVKKIREIKGDLYKSLGPGKCIELMQDFGDNIRKCGNPYDYQKTYENKNVINKKLVKEKEDTRYELVRDVKNIISLLSKKGNHKVFLINSLRNPHEILYLRKQFINFYLVSIFAPEEIRLNRLKEKNETIEEKIFKKMDERDSGKDVKAVDLLYKQNVTLCNRLADISINNYVAEEELEKKFSEEERKKNREYRDEDFKRKILKYFALIIDKGCTKPNDDEHLMNQAYALAMKSNCISRQVGAVIVDKEGYIIGAGWNDVGEGHLSCGLIEIKDLEETIFQRYVECLLKKETEESNRKEIKEGIKEWIRKIYGFNEDKKIPDEHCVCFNELFSIKKFEKKCKKVMGNKFPFKEINEIYQKKIENCRALHAEENAILQSARRGGMGLKGAKIYITTYPCPLCARKILQVGMTEIIYDDPYPAELSEMFLQDGQEKVALRHFEGVKPLGYFKLFKPVYDQKEWQELELNNLLERYEY